jgi:hypothetical protein
MNGLLGGFRFRIEQQRWIEEQLQLFTLTQCKPWSHSDGGVAPFQSIMLTRY